MRVYWEDPEDPQSTIAAAPLTGEDLEASLRDAGEEYTVEDYLREEDVYEETCATYRYLQEYLRAYRPGILQRLTFREWMDLVADTTDVRARAPESRWAQPPRPIPPQRQLPPWPRQLVSLGTAR